MLADLLAEEFGIYHKGVITNSRIARLIFCNNLTDNEETVNGLAEVGRFVLDTLVINASKCSWDWERLRCTLHHELFAIDFYDDTEHFLDPEWRKLNGKDFKYNDALQFLSGVIYSDSAYVPHFDFGDIDKVPAGFLTRYATQSVHEDKAVFYSWLLVRYCKLLEIANADSIVAAKMNKMKKLLSRFHNSFDTAFWEKMNSRSLTLSTNLYTEWKEKLKELR
jgi:hypothetical protein